MVVENMVCRAGRGEKNKTQIFEHSEYLSFLLSLYFTLNHVSRLAIQTFTFFKTTSWAVLGHTWNLLVPLCQSYHFPMNKNFHFSFESELLLNNSPCCTILYQAATWCTMLHHTAKRVKKSQLVLSFSIVEVLKVFLRAWFKM